MPNSYSVLSQSIYKKIRSFQYECLICCKIIRPSSEELIWTCDDCCYAVFHWKCISKWKRSETRPETCSSTRCPTCRYEYTEQSFPVGKSCFCGRSLVLNTMNSAGDKSTRSDQKPESLPSETDLTSRSKREIKNFCCKNACGKKIKECGHSCRTKCHPGPCQSCPQVVSQSCACGRTKRSARCSDATEAFVCKKICSKPLDCQKHKCTQPCHQGECQKCEWTSLMISCGCGKENRQFSCLEATQHGLQFSCSNPCDLELDCGNHRCTEPCHSSCEQKCLKRHRTRCYCGRTELSPQTKEQLLLNCNYVIESCGSRCGKRLGCGHSCEAVCHEGDCGLASVKCNELISVTCRCGSSIHHIPCWQRRISDVLCDRLCSEYKQCGKHKCNQVCCPGSNAKQLSYVDMQSIHKCNAVCGKRLTCNVHYCQQHCHTGRCNPCAQTSFDELSCHCGLTRILPPVYCDAKLPECPHPCRRTTNRCQEHLHHDLHPCHPEEECPPCSVLVKVPCHCGASLHTEECWKRHVRKICGKPCRKQLSCGHSCPKPCHPGECGPCSVICNRATDSFRACGHRCQQRCQFGRACDEFLDCLATVDAACGCGALKSSVSCCKLAQDQYIPCNEACRIKQRNEQLAKAFGIAINNPTVEPQPVYSEFLISFMKEHFYFCLKVEAIFAAFADKPVGSIFHFWPMYQQKRRFVCEYANVWSIEFEVVDHEPVRSILLWKRQSSAPILKPAIFLSNIDPSFCVALRDLEDKLNVVELNSTLHDKSQPYNGLIVRFTEDRDYLMILDYLSNTHDAALFEWKLKDDEFKIKFNCNISTNCMRRIKKFILRSVFGAVVEFASLSFDCSSDELHECEGPNDLYVAIE